MLKKIILSLILIFITGCSGFSSQPSGQITSTDFRKGTSGLEVEFLEDNMLKEVYEEEIFRINALLQNKGASDIRNGIMLIGIEEDYMEMLYERYGYYDVDFALEGVSIKNPIGEQKIEEFAIKAKKIDSQTEEHTSLIYLTYCYDYKTEFSQNVCIDPDPHKVPFL